MEEKVKVSLRSREEVLGAEEKQDFQIPPKRHSWLIRVFMALAIIIIIVGVGVGAYMYQQPNSILKRSNADNDKKVSDSLRSVDATDESDIDSDAKSLIQDINTASDVTKTFEAISPTTKFAPDTEKIYVTIQTKNLSEAKQLKVEWFYVPEDTFIDEGTYGAEKGINKIAFHLEQPAQGSWPEGEYQIKISIDGELAQIARFEVEKDTEETVDSQP